MTTQTTHEKLANYKSYRGLPVLAGVATMEEAARPGLSIERCVARLKRYHYALKRLHEIFTARITAEPVYELKSAWSLHAWMCAEHAMAVRTRVAEMREPPLGLDAVPDASLEIFFDEILGAATTQELLVGLYEKAVPALEAGLKRHMADTNPLADHPSARLCRFALVEVGDMRAFGAKAVPCMASDADRAAMAGWTQLLDDCLAAAGALDGVDKPSGKTIARQRSAKPYVFDPVPKRDERFKDLFNQGVNAETFVYDPNMPVAPKTLMLLFKRIREIDVPEMMANIIFNTKGKPWGYYRDMSRQLWDEARHAMMGEVGFAAMGVDWTRARITHNWSLRLNTECTPREAHAVLYYIEQGLMTKTGKRFEWEVGLQSGNPLVALFQDYDWADEVLHAAIGRDWLITQFADKKEAVDFGDKAWSKVLSNWEQVRDKGLTKHENWWPDLYRDACRNWGVEPDPAALAFKENYNGQRADLAKVSVSG